MAYLKPQSPLQKGSDFVYPLTTIDQVIMDDGSRLNTQKVSVESYTNMCLNGNNTLLNGYGSVTVKLYPTGIAEVQFYIEINGADASATNEYNWGINRDFFPQFNSTIPVITPIPNCGWWAHLRNGTLLLDSMRWGPTFEVSGQFWKFSRNYGGATVALGTYPASWPYTNDAFIGTCYGTYTPKS